MADLLCNSGTQCTRTEGCACLWQSLSELQVRYWDITSGEQIHRLEGHTDYVRAAAVSPADSNLWATGGGSPLEGSLNQIAALCTSLAASVISRSVCDATAIAVRERK